MEKSYTVHFNWHQSDDEARQTQFTVYRHHTHRVLELFENFQIKIHGACCSPLPPLGLGHKLPD